MKKSITTETTITIELTRQDLDEYAIEKKLIPSDWEHFSVDVRGNGVSNGGVLIFKKIEFKNS